jgi:fucose 4-O-acetylase-like acetyltransferase
LRDKQIDLLRFVGLSFLILGHVEPPGWIFQLRNFNVPLLVMASAMIVAKVTLKDTYLNYIWKRIKRLAFPAWIFLTFYFLFLWLTGIAPKNLTAQHIWDNYTFSNAGGFMWIIRIFLLVALVAPLIYQINQKVRSNTSYLRLLGLAYIVYEGLIYLLDLCPEGLWTDFTVSFIGYTLGYGLVFALGLRLARLTAKEMWTIGGLSFCIFGVLMTAYYLTEGRLVQTQEHKYPPSAYYLSYALAASFATWGCAKYVCDFLSKYSWLERGVMFIAQNTLWIYLWHTIFIYITYRMPGYNFLTKYLVVYSLSALAAFVQINAIHKWILPRISSESARKNIKLIFTG